MSNLGSLNFMDLLKGFIMVIVSALIAGVYQALQTGGITFTWAFFQPIVITAVVAGLAYLVKQLGTNSDGLPLVKESPK